ncbi:MAG: hypothetical protein ACREBR_02910 [bacterium]
MGLNEIPKTLKFEESQEDHALIMKAAAGKLRARPSAKTEVITMAIYFQNTISKTIFRRVDADDEGSQTWQFYDKDHLEIPEQCLKNAIFTRS